MTTDEGEQYEGLIREKSRFSEVKSTDPDLARPAYSRYSVELRDGLESEALFDEDHVKRKPRIFTKANMRLLLRQSLQRPTKPGMPWAVKEAIAERYHLPTVVPAHLLEVGGSPLTASTSADTRSPRTVGSRRPRRMAKRPNPPR